MKICLAASAGGHLTQLLQLTEAFQSYDCFFVTTEQTVTSSLMNHGNVYIVKKANRKEPFRLILMLVRCLNIFFKEKPDVAISTGAAVGCIISTLAKLTGRKTIWIDSIANIDRLSLSGRIVRPFADIFLVQWRELPERYKGVKYLGQVI